MSIVERCRALAPSGKDPFDINDLDIFTMSHVPGDLFVVERRFTERHEDIIYMVARNVSYLEKGAFCLRDIDPSLITILTSPAELRAEIRHEFAKTGPWDHARRLDHASGIGVGIDRVPENATKEARRRYHALKRGAMVDDVSFVVTKIV